MTGRFSPGNYATSQYKLHVLQQLDSGAQRGKVGSVPQQVTVPNQQTCKVSFGTVVAALAALSMAVLGHFFI